MSQQPQMTMAGMGGGPVGPPMNVGTPGNAANQDNNTAMKRLNTAIYDYMLRNSMYEVARLFQKEVEIDFKPDIKQSPNQQNGQLANGIDDGADANMKDDGLRNRPNDLPMPASMGGGGPFLQDWWCQFWEIFNGHRQRSTKSSTVAYIHQQRHQQNGRMSMMGGKMEANTMQNMRGYNNMMPGMNNGMMPDNLKRAAMQQQQQQRNMTPAQLQQAKNMQSAQQNAMMSGNQMERQGSQMDMSGPRSGSPGSGDAPSPKRQRLEGNMQPGRPGQPGQMQGNQVGPQPDFPHSDPTQLQKVREMLLEKGHDPDDIPTAVLRLAERRPEIQAQAVDVYSKSISKHMQLAINNNPSSNMNKGMPPNIGPGGAQGSPMSQPGMDGQTGEFYAATSRNGQVPMQPGPNGPGAAGQGNSNGSHALQDYQMQLMLLEQQNKKRLLMARQEQDSMAHPTGVAPNGQFAPGMSPQGSQRGGDPSPNPNEMQRGMMDPNQVAANMRAQQMMMNQNAQQLRPPSSHPGAMGGMTQQQQMEAIKQQQQMANGVFPPGAQPPQGQMMPGQQPGPGGQPGQGQPMGTPRQQPNNMGPPPAPTNASGTNPSSPAQPPAPPTPQQGNKQKGGAKSEPKKKATAKKNNSQTGATPASESEQAPTPTPATPITPMNSASFNPNKAQQLPNGAPQPTSQPNNALTNNIAQQQQNQVQQPGAVQQPPPAPTDMNAPFGNLDDGSFSNMNLDFGNLDGSDVLDNFDFDSFLNPDGGDGLSFDAQYAFGDSGLEAGGLDAPN